jgi:hypothetical protein
MRFVCQKIYPLVMTSGRRQIYIIGATRAGVVALATEKIIVAGLQQMFVHSMA